MRDDIRQKLKRELQSEIDSEARVVYLLVQVRKLLDAEQPQRDVDSLRLSCNWVAHSSLDNKVVRRLVALFNAEEEFLDLRMPPTEMIAEVDFSRFREQLAEVIRDHGLDPTRITDKSAWNTFLRYFVRVIEDSPLQVPLGEGGSTSGVVVNAEEIDHPQGRMLAIKWTTLRRDGRPGSVNITQHRIS